MGTPSEQFITTMKLRELRKQRTHFHSAYTTLATQVAAAPDEPARVQVLYDGLRAIQFADQPLHPTVANLDPLLLTAAHGQAPPATLAYWRAALDTERVQGARRAELVYLFGALLEEWSFTPRRDLAAQAEAQAQRGHLLQHLLHPPAPTDPTRLTAWCASWGGTPAERAPYWTDTVGAHWRGRVTGGEVTTALQAIATDRDRAPSRRREARQLATQAVLVKELADALTIQLDQLDTWTWPAGGVRTIARWNHRKWRLFFDEDLPTACLLELLGTRWSTAVQDFFPYLVRCEAARREAARATGDEEEVEVLREDRANRIEYGSVLTRRQTLRRKLQARNQQGGYRASGDQPLLQAIQWVQAEIQLARAAFPDEPLYVLKADLADFYPSLPHALLLTLLAACGLTPDQQAFFARWLAVPLHTEQAVQSATRGVPTSRRLSHCLGDLVLRLLDTALDSIPTVQTIRVGDDLCLVTPSADAAQQAWDTVQAFCAATGLQLNAEKCGAMAIGGPLPAGLPPTPPTWLLLALDPHGTWTVHAPALRTYIEAARQQIAAAPTLIAQVESYNRQVGYLSMAVALDAALGPAHRASAVQALFTFAGTVGAAGASMIAALQAQITACFPDVSALPEVPEAWFYWPLTAGGLGLRQVSILAVQVVPPRQEARPPAVPPRRRATWDRRMNVWSRYYESLLEPAVQRLPVTGTVMETQVEDFIARGAELSAGGQETLATYWRWVLYLDGPEILHALGTFRFLITELVPVQLITGGRLGTDEGEEPPGSV